MVDPELFAVKVELLIPELIRRQERALIKKHVQRQYYPNPFVHGAIKSLSRQIDSSSRSRSQVDFEQETRDRVKTLIASAKNGSFGADESCVSQKNAQKLASLSKELFDTEKRYLETLRILKDISDKVQTTESLQYEILKDVFKEMPSLYMLHNFIDGKFYRDSSQDPTFSSWVEIFTSAQISPFFNIYKTFLTRFRTKIEALQSIYDKDKSFQQFCQSLVLTSVFTEQHIQSIPGFYIGIQSRLMRYQLLLQKISVLTDGIDHERCESALNMIINILKTSEEEVTKNEMINQAIEINSKLDGRKNNLDRLSLYIRSGPCLKIPRRSVGKKPLNRYLFLFSDYLVMTEPEQITTGHFLVKSELTIVSMILEEPKLDDGIPVDKCIRVRAVECVVELMFANAEEKMSWWKSLTDAIDQERKRNTQIPSATPLRPSSSDLNGENTSRAAEWVKDEQATMCALCYKQFTHIRRKHHCRACGKIFCGVCSNYKAVVEHLGEVEVRVCEIDYYRLNPNIKPKTAAAMERVAQFSQSGQKNAPYHCSFLMYTKKVRNHWPHRRTHVRVEYSTGVVHNHHQPNHQHSVEKPPSHPPATPASPVTTPHSEHNSPSMFLSTPLRKMSLDFASDMLASAAAAEGSESTTILPLPAARIILRPQTSRGFCVLHPDTLLAIYAAKEDAKSCDSTILLGARLVYLVSLRNEVKKQDSDVSIPKSTSARSSSCGSEARSIHGIAGHEGRLCKPEGKAFVEIHSANFVPRIQSQRAVFSMLTPSTDQLDNDSFDETDGSSENSGDADGTSMVVGREAKVATNGAKNGKNGIVQNKLGSHISMDTLSVLSNMNGFVVLPNNTDKIAHYFEAPSEDVRNEWIDKIKKCILDFDQQ